MWYSKSQQQLRLPQTVRPVSSMTCSDAVRCFHVSRCEMAQPTRKVIWAPRDIRDKSCKRLAMAVGFHGFKSNCSDASLYRRWTFNCLCSFLMGFYGSGWVGGFWLMVFVRFSQEKCNSPNMLVKKCACNIVPVLKQSRNKQVLVWKKLKHGVSSYQVTQSGQLGWYVHVSIMSCCSTTFDICTCGFWSCQMC